MIPRNSTYPKARSPRRYSWFSAHDQGVAFLGPNASLMKNSYSVAALTPIGRLFCSYVAGANAPPVPFTQQAAYDADMQVRLDHATFVRSAWCQWLATASCLG